MAKHVTIRGGGARSCIARKEPFTAGHDTVFSENLSRHADGSKISYAVYSYGRHFPMFVYDYESETWFETAQEGPSRTTKRHLTQCRPYPGLTKLSKADLYRVIELGYVALARKRVAGAEA